jgi:nucleotide-binding universal stress UspA family protein
MNLDKILVCVDGSVQANSAIDVAASLAKRCGAPLIILHVVATIPSGHLRGELLYPRVGFVVTNLSRPAELVVAFYNQRGPGDQWIEEARMQSTGRGCHAVRSRPTLRGFSPARNVHAGAKYMRRLNDKYFPDAQFDEQNRTLFAFASYNARPIAIAPMRKLAAAQGLQQDVWFNNVERVTAANIGRETVRYVRKIYKYYVAYKLLQEHEQEGDLVQ